MTDHSGLLDRYRRVREVRSRLNNLLVETISKEILQECGKILGFYRRGMLFFETDDETSLLMDYCLYYPQPDGRNLVARYLENLPAAADSDERVVLETMTHAYYSMFQITEVQRGVGVGVMDLLRDEAGFLVDVGLGNSARQHMMLATRVIPFEGFLTTSGAALPVVASAARQTMSALTRAKLTPEALDFRRITPLQEAELAALIIRTCRSTGMSSHVAYAEPGALPPPGSEVSESRSSRRNVLCPCRSGKKYRVCCGRR